MVKFINNLYSQILPEMFYEFTKQKYEGEYKNGKRHGKGTIKMLNGDVFEGNFIEGVFKGDGVYTFKNGTKKEGYFTSLYKMKGKGQLKLSTGETLQLDDGKRGTFIIYGDEKSGKSTLLKQFKRLLTEENIISEYDSQDMIKDIIRVFQFISKEILRLDPNHLLLDDLKFIMILNESDSMDQNIFNSILKIFETQECKKVLIKFSLEFENPEELFRIGNWFYNHTSSLYNFSNMDSIRIHLPGAKVPKFIANKNDLFYEFIEFDPNSSIQEILLLKGNTKAVYCVNLLNTFRFDYDITKTLQDFEETILKEDDIFLVFSKNDLFSTLFENYSDKFQANFPKKYFEKHEQKAALEYITSYFTESIQTLKRNVKIFYLNILDPQDVTKLLNLDISIEKEEIECVKKEKEYFTDYFFNMNKEYPLPKEVYFNNSVIKVEKNQEITELILKEDKNPLPSKWREYDNDSKSSDLMKYKRSKTLGSGAFGSADLCIKNDKICVLKQIPCGIDINQANEAMKESLIGLKLNHPNVLKYNNLFQSNYQELETTDEQDEDGNFKEEKVTYYSIFIESEYCPLGNLKMVAQKTRLDEGLILDFITQIISGIQYIHENDIVHRDIKPENIFAKSNGDQIVLVLADFGCSKTIHSIKINSVKGTETYISP